MNPLTLKWIGGIVIGVSVAMATTFIVWNSCRIRIPDDNTGDVEDDEERGEDRLLSPSPSAEICSDACEECSSRAGCPNRTDY